jgi:hypothetical protein
MTIKDIKLDGTSVPIREFKLSWMVPNPSICMLAKRGSGKSWVVRSILNYFNDLPGGVVIAPTDRMNTFYGNFFPEVYIHYQYRSDIIEKILFRQETMIQKAMEKAKQKKKVDPRAFLVMDDCLSSKGTWMKDEPIMKLFFDGRHYKIMYILTMQFPLGISPELRCNFDYIFLLSEDFYSNQKRLYDHYAGMFPDFRSFRDVFNEVTNDYGAMVIVNRGSRKNFLDKVFWFKASDEKMDNFGCRQFSEFNKNNYNPKWRYSSHPFDINKFVLNKDKKSKIRVEKLTNQHIIQ